MSGYEIDVELADDGMGGQKLKVPTPDESIGVKGGHTNIIWKFKGFSPTFAPSLQFVGGSGDALVGLPTADPGPPQTISCTLHFPTGRTGPTFTVSYQVLVGEGLLAGTIPPVGASLVIDRSVDPPGGTPPPHPHRRPRRPRGGAGKAPAPYSPTRRRNSGSPASER